MKLETFFEKLRASQQNMANGCKEDKILCPMVIVNLSKLGENLAKNASKFDRFTP